MESNVPFSESCRVCSAEFEHGVLLFSDEGKRLYLQAKIRKYLYITVSMDDKLPKVLCENCCKKLDSIHKFATMALRNQDMFNKLMNDTGTYPSMEPKKVESKGLLHTYLTKGINTSEDTEEMEVRVDPMLILQYTDGESDPDEDEEKFSEKQIKHEAKPEPKYAEIKCSLCPKTFPSQLSLQHHIWCHSPENKRVVLNNHNNFYVKADVKHEEVDDREDENVESEGTVNDNYDADPCENGNVGKFGCPICGKVISTKGNLKVHLETHRPKGKYGCDICGRIFKTQCNLHRHKEYHTGVQFTCNVCGRVYPTNSTLRAHSITHSDLRPHKCPLCDKTFKRNQDLKFHINQHTGARPYQCPYCPKAFASSGNCFSHRKRMHPLEVERDRERAAKIMR